MQVVETEKNHLNRELEDIWGYDVSNESSSMEPQRLSPGLKNEADVVSRHTANGK